MMFNRRTMLAGMITATAAPLALRSRAFAKTQTIPLTISSSHPTVIPWVTPLKSVIVAKSNERLAELGSDYRIDWTEAYGGTLYNFNDTLEAVSQQLTDMGWIGALWEPNALPLQNIMLSTPFATSTVHQALDVMNGLNDIEPAMKDEWAQQNVEFFGCCVSDGYHLFTKKPINTLADIEGLRILGVPVAAPLIEAVGGTLVATGIPSMYSQLQTGIGDGVILIATGAYPLKLHEVAKYVTRVDTGPFTFGGFGVNADTFAGLPEEVQGVIAELGREYSNENARIIETLEPQIWKKFAEEGAVVHQMPQEQRVEWVNRLPDLGKIWVETNEAKGIPAKRIMVEFMETLRDQGGEPLRDWAANV